MVDAAARRSPGLGETASGRTGGVRIHRPRFERSTIPAQDR
ncbi:MAG TPA: hypothetical protein VGX00_06175 [Thermoplasmata archaeon]|nr:hypothetical protein [Thermoplasmata archaeon]